MKRPEQIVYGSGHSGGAIKKAFARKVTSAFLTIKILSPDLFTKK